MRYELLLILFLATYAGATPPAGALPSCVKLYGEVDMSCIGRGKGLTQLQEHSIGGSYVTNYENVLRTTLPGIRDCHERSTLAASPGHTGGIRVVLKLAPDGTVSAVASSMEQVDDGTLVACVVALFRPLRFQKPTSAAYGEVKYTVSFTTLRPVRSIDQEAAELCQVAEKMKADPSWSRDKVLTETAVRFDALQPSPAVRGLLSTLATAPRAKLYSEFRDGLAKLGAKKPDCAVLEELWRPWP